jgi:hypothetical protein
MELVEKKEEIMTISFILHQIFDIYSKYINLLKTKKLSEFDIAEAISPESDHTFNGYSIVNEKYLYKTVFDGIVSENVRKTPISPS